MVLMMDGKFLVSSHHEGKLTVYDADECSVQLYDSGEVFPEVETIWGMERIGILDDETSCEYFVVATTNGIYVCAIYENGKVLYS